MLAKTWIRQSVLVVLCGVLLTGCGDMVKTERLGGPVEHDRLVDDIYEGSAKGGPNSAAVRVTIADQRIKEIEILKHSAWRGKKADPVIPQRIIDHQSTAVDAVSGATNSSHVIMNAVQDALEQAYQAAQ